MIYRQNNFYRSSVARGKRVRRGLVLVATLALALLIFGGLVLDKVFGPSAWAIASPLWRGQAFLADNLHALTASISDKYALETRNRELRGELAAARVAAAAGEQWRRENLALRAELKLGAPAVFAVGRVISSPWNSPYDLLLVEVSTTTAALLNAGDLVTYQNTLALGRVVAITDQLVKVALFSAGQLQTPAWLLSSTGQVAVSLLGRGDGNFVLELPRQLGIELEAPAVLRANEQDYLLALVGAVARPTSESSQKIYLRSPVNLADLTYVEFHPHSI